MNQRRVHNLIRRAPWKKNKPKTKHKQPSKSSNKARDESVKKDKNHMKKN